jgi:hypothetical protein
VAYESYHDPALSDQGYCTTCHPGFTGGRSDTLHALHTGGSDPVTNNCDLCHTTVNRDNPLIMWSADGLGCTGCHGRDYGETIEADYRGFSISGLPKASGYGLRRHHKNSGITVCLDCHADGDSFPEHAPLPPYYSKPEVSLGGAALDPCTNEDSENDTGTLGRDNDGDLLYDGDDPDCVGYTVQYEHFALFVARWLETPCGPANIYCGGADIDRLGDVDGIDLARFGASWLGDRPDDWLLP